VKKRLCLCTMPTFGVTGHRTGAKYIYSLDELLAYESSLAQRGLKATPRWTDAGRAALAEQKDRNNG
jgi:hypothetical protein